jgi:hypothetical protein
MVLFFSFELWKNKSSHFLLCASVLLVLLLLTEFSFFFFFFFFLLPSDREKEEQVVFEKVFVITYSLVINFRNWNYKKLQNFFECHLTTSVYKSNYYN